MSFQRPVQWNFSQADVIWPDGTLKGQFTVNGIVHFYYRGTRKFFGIISHTIHIYESGVFFGLTASVKSSHWQDSLEYLHTHSTFALNNLHKNNRFLVNSCGILSNLFPDIRHFFWILQGCGSVFIFYGSGSGSGSSGSGWRPIRIRIRIQYGSNTDPRL